MRLFESAFVASGLISGAQAASALFLGAEAASSNPSALVMGAGGDPSTLNQVSDLQQIINKCHKNIRVNVINVHLGLDVMSKSNDLAHPYPRNESTAAPHVNDSSLAHEAGVNPGAGRLASTGRLVLIGIGSDVDEAKTAPKAKVQASVMAPEARAISPKSTAARRVQHVSFAHEAGLNPAGSRLASIGLGHDADEAQKASKAKVQAMYHLISLNGYGELDLSPGNWNLFSDSCVHTAVCKLFQMKVQCVYEDCSADGDECIHHRAYSGEPGLLASQEYEVTSIDVPMSGYENVQDFFDKEHNTFGKLGWDKKTKKRTKKVSLPCGSDIDLCGRRLAGCSKGRRMRRMVITQPPQILELYLVVQEEDRIINPDRFEHLLNINGREYTFAGALLNNGGVHFRCLGSVKGCYLMYDGMWASKKLKWVSGTEDFKCGMFAGKLWYVLTPEGASDIVPSSVAMGYPDGLYIGPKKHVRLVGDKCARCDQEVGNHTPCLAVKEKEGKEGMCNVLLYHLPKCCNGFDERADEVEQAIVNSPYPDNEKKNIRKLLDGIVFGEAGVVDLNAASEEEEEGGEDGENNEGNSDGDGKSVSSEETLPVGSVGFRFRKQFDDGWHTGRVCQFRSGAKDGKNRRVVYEDGDGEDMKLKEIRECVKLARVAGESVEAGAFSKEYSLRVGDVIKYDDSTNSDEFGVEAEVRATVVSIQIQGTKKEKWTIVTEPVHSGLKAGGDEEVEVVSSQYHYFDAPPVGLCVNISELNLIPGECTNDNAMANGMGKEESEGLEVLAAVAEVQTTDGPQTCSKRKGTGSSGNNKEGEQKTKKKKKES